MLVTFQLAAILKEKYILFNVQNCICFNYGYAALRENRLIFFYPNSHLCTIANVCQWFVSDWFRCDPLSMWISLMCAISVVWAKLVATANTLVQHSPLLAMYRVGRPLLRISSVKHALVWHWPIGFARLVRYNRWLSWMYSLFAFDCDAFQWLCYCFCAVFHNPNRHCRWYPCSSICVAVFVFASIRPLH